MKRTELRTTRDHDQTSLRSRSSVRSIHSQQSARFVGIVQNQTRGSSARLVDLVAASLFHDFLKAFREQADQLCLHLLLRIDPIFGPKTRDNRRGERQRENEIQRRSMISTDPDELMKDNHESGTLRGNRKRGVLVHQYGTSCFQPSVHNPTFEPRPVSDPTTPRPCSKLIDHTPATLFASLVVAQQGQAKRQIGCASNLEAIQTE
ncbi:hypothetical protein BLNAU_18436 [Blattamonas nauphoetae]|uniref:Uncharacterized protein n=1 Tax=Blattamonas nauphoetae TaxID=2049346 RepID=A0ABQ9X8U7_9EUKA|nr:hypothetical protein BLNAU_18436 [Blattamonas nauphoetae]